MARMLILPFKMIRVRSITTTAIRNTPVNMAYTVYDEDTLGNKPPVLVLHGLFGSRNNWNSLSRSLNRQTKRKIIAADFRNHGDSPHTQKMTFQNLAWDIQHLLDKLNIKESILLGHSMGGAAVMFTALTYPYLLEKLVVVDMSPVKTRSGPLEISGIMSAMNSVDFRGLQTLSQARQHADKVLSETIRSSTLRQFLITNVKEESPGSFKWKVNVPSLMEHFGPEIVGFPALLARLGGKTFTKPTLFISGGRSDYMTKEDHPGTRKLFPGAEFVYIEDAAHWLHVEKPVEFLKIASDFINS